MIRESRQSSICTGGSLEASSVGIDAVSDDETILVVLDSRTDVSVGFNADCRGSVVVLGSMVCKDDDKPLATGTIIEDASDATTLVA